MILGVPCLLLLVLIGALSPANSIPSSHTGGKPNSAPQVHPIDTMKENVKSEATQSRGKVISGIVPSDIYLGFEKNGFKTTKKIGTEGSFFYSDFSSNGIEYHVTVFCSEGVSGITSVRLQATRIEPQLNDLNDIKPFLKFGCSLPYDGSDQQKISSFIDEYYNKDKASIVISGIRFTIFAPTKFYRGVEIETE